MRMTKAPSSQSKLLCLLTRFDTGIGIGIGIGFGIGFGIDIGIGFGIGIGIGITSLFRGAYAF